MRVGVFDSGLGGLSVLRAIRAELPDAELIYLADQANLPYGTRSPEEIRARVLGVSDWLIAQDCAAVVLACNTATAAGIRAAREQRPGYVFVGMEPAVKPAAEATRTGVVGVLATPGTLRGQHFQQTRARHAAHVQVIERACIGWVEAVESGLGGARLDTLLRREVEPLLDAGADWLVLGCTHFPFLADAIADIALGRARLLDPAPAVARQLCRLLSPRRSPAAAGGGLQAFTTGNPTRLADGIHRLIGETTTPHRLAWRDYVLDAN